MRTVVPRPAARLWRSLLLLLLPLAFVSGCASFVPDYDQPSRDRIVAISEDILGLYQELLTTPPAARRAKVAELQPLYNKIDTELQVDLMLEEVRSKNDESIRIAQDLSAHFQDVRKSHQSGDPDALKNVTLVSERDIFQGILTAALKAEDAKKLANPVTGGAS